ncbi:hypothetical protein AB0F93_03470 [Micromonospora tulbaghiae]|uniref:hypothetical protein n=1 Tax=Micromonospora tulbaghiae TaxID=479978 RepID=UPI003331DC66
MATLGGVVGGAVGMRRWGPGGPPQDASAVGVPGALLGPGRDYEPRVGDVWMVSVVRPVGVSVALPRRWRGSAHRPRVRWRGRLADQSLWHFVLDEVPASRAVLVRFGTPVDADMELRVFRPAALACPVCGAAQEQAAGLEVGYCGPCSRFTGTPLAQLVRRWAAGWELPAADEQE